MKKKTSYKHSILFDGQIRSLELLQVKFKNRYLRENISFAKKMTLETGTSQIRFLWTALMGTLVLQNMGQA